MRLLTKTTLYFLLAIIPLLFAGGYLMFQQFSAQINERADKELVYEEVQWIQYLEATTNSESKFILRSPDLLIYPTYDEPSLQPTITTIKGRKARANLEISIRQLEHVVNINGIAYQIVIRKSQEQKQALVANITRILLLVFGGLLLATLLFNWIISRRLWKPFQKSLHKVRNLELQKMDDIHFEKTNIEEFSELNAALNTMVQKIQNDYRNMREFTENAAHEMQTPLAIAQSKLELLLQDARLNETQVGTIAQTTDALSRLSKLNQSLLLLAKIENSQFEATERISLKQVTQKYLNLFDEVIKDKELIIEQNIEDDFGLLIHPFLADSLVSNLVGNAIKYNYKGGKISLHITAKEYCISNSSHQPAIDPSQLFLRFKSSGNHDQPSTGLGLAIVKRIVDTSGLSISYQKEEMMHRFCIRS